MKTHVATAVSASALLILLCGCASSSSGRLLNVGVIGSKAADQVMTDAAEARGGREGNPLVGHQQWRQVLVGAAGVSGVIGAAFLVEAKGHPIWAHVIRIVAISAWSGAAIWNARQ